MFSGVAMTRAVDFASTKNFRSRGRDEILLTNDLVDNTPAFVAVQAGGVVASIAASSNLGFQMIASDDRAEKKSRQRKWGRKHLYFWVSRWRFLVKLAM